MKKQSQNAFILKTDLFVFVCTQFTKGTNSVNNENGLFDIQHDTTNSPRRLEEEENWGVVNVPKGAAVEMTVGTANLVITNM